MTDCISLIDTRVAASEIATWVQVSQLKNVVHTEEIEILSVASGYLDIEPFCVPDLDCRIIGALVYHSCDTGLIHSFTCEPICHVYQYHCDTCVKLDCWTLNPKEELESREYEWVDDPCERLTFLRNCQMEWLKAGKKTTWSFRDSSGGKQYLSERCLKDLIAEARSECESVLGVQGSRCLKFGCGRGYC